MLWIKGSQLWILVIFTKCVWGESVLTKMLMDFNATKDATQTMLIRAADGFRENWHGDKPNSYYESSNVRSSDFYSTRILKQLTLLNKKFDRMMIRMVGSTIRDDGDEDVENINWMDTRPGCESMIGAEAVLPSGIYHFDGSIGTDLEWIWNVYAIYCDQSAGGGWTVVQRRGGPEAGNVNFGKSWEDYAKGFGDLSGEFWLGNEWIHRLTTFFGPYQLRIELEDWDGNKTWAEYSEFKIGSEAQNYRLFIGNYTGNATDTLSIRNSTAFSTHDRRNDHPDPDQPCKSVFIGGWWYIGDCLYANINGYYYTKSQHRGPFTGMAWNDLHNTDQNIKLKNVKMMVRLKNHPALDRARILNPQ